MVRTFSAQMDAKNARKVKLGMAFLSAVGALGAAYYFLRFKPKMEMERVIDLPDAVQEAMGKDDGELVKVSDPVAEEMKKQRLKEKENELDEKAAMHIAVPFQPRVGKICPRGELVDPQFDICILCDGERRPVKGSTPWQYICNGTNVIYQYDKPAAGFKLDALPWARGHIMGAPSGRVVIKSSNGIFAYKNKVRVTDGGQDDTNAGLVHGDMGMVTLENYKFNDPLELMSGTYRWIRYIHTIF